MKLTVLIKTYNEQAKISSCLEALFVALAEWGGEAEVIVADSRSTDATIEIASRFPVTVVCLSEQESRGCGIGVQLGFQHAHGDFLLLLDGDMQLQPGFLNAALQILNEKPMVGGVAGLLEDTEMRNRFDRHRMVTKPSAKSGVQEWLSGGGLYRRSAIEDAGGYAANRNLLAYEEAELGLRLGARDWQLVRLPIPYVRHTGHALDTFGVMRRMWVSGRMAAGGVLLRSAILQPWLPRVLRMFIHPLAVILFWLLFVAMAFFAWPLGPLVPVTGLLAAVTLLAIRRKSLGDSLFSLLLWHLTAAGILRGLVHNQVPPTHFIRSEVVFSPNAGGSNHGA